MMDSDVWERARRFVEEGERQQAEKEAILAQYERVNIHGKVLVDGHHVFLEMLRDIETFNHHVEEHPSFLRSIKNIWLDPHPAYVAQATDHVIGLLHEILPLEVAQQFVGSDKSCIPASAAVKGLQEQPSRYCVVEDGHRDILIFDARMPSAANVIKKLEQEKRRFRFRQGVVPLEIERRLKLVRAGRWEFWGDDALTELPYGSRNEFLDALKHPWYGWKEHLGKRGIRISRGRFRQNEKGVDARLVIAGCQAAADPKLDWTCLVTNDADYVPLVQHLHSRGKAVYLLSLCDPARQSRDLKNAVGARYLINKAELYNGFPKEPIPEPYRSKPALVFLRPYCSLAHLGARLGGEAERLFDPVKHMEFLKRYDDVLLGGGAPQPSE
jgi:uncharacterized LabA/DUF88 family protein